MCRISSAVLMEGFLSKKEKAAKADNRLIMKFGKQRWRVKLYLTDILELIVNSLDQRSFPEHNLVMLKHQSILHTLFQTRDEVDSVNEELFEEVFRDIAPKPSFLGRQQAGYRLFALTLQIGCRTRYGGNQTSCVIGRRDRNASGLEKRRSGKG